ncbi:MAG TPA: four helix bundle protein [Patescibacteria group bacterium]
MDSFKFENLDIWKLAYEYADEIHDLTKSFPKDELFSLSGQLNRSSSSIPDNIAEGTGSTTIKDCSNYLQVSIKSTYESVSQLYRAFRRDYITLEQKNYFYHKANVLVAKIISFKKSINSRGKF